MNESAIHAVNHIQYQALEKGAAVYPRPDAGVLQVTGADRADFLQRMTTNNIAVLRPGDSAVTVLTSPTARIVFTFTVVCRSDDLLLLPAPGEAGSLSRHLRGQIFFMDKVTVQDLGESYTRLRVLGPGAAGALALAGLDVAGLSDNGVLAHDDHWVVNQPRYEVRGYELVVPRDRQEALMAALTAAGAVHLADEYTYQARRIELGRPAPGTELVEEYNPLEAGLGWACSENKGCYTGQEIIARQITYDKVTRTLVGLQATQPLTPGAEVRAEGRAMGTVTSAAYSPTLEAPVALAVVKRPANAPGTAVEVDGRPATVVALPFVPEAQG